jgi:hypothetical protein
MLAEGCEVAALAAAADGAADEDAALPENGFALGADGPTGPGTNGLLLGGTPVMIQCNWKKIKFTSKQQNKDHDD